MSRKLKSVSPGEMLAEEFLKPLGMSNCRLAKEIGVPAQRIGQILAGKRAITADTDLRLCRFFGRSDGWWLRLQADCDTEVAKAALAKTLAKIKPWQETAEQTADQLRTRGSWVQILPGAPNKSLYGPEISARLWVHSLLGAIARGGGRIHRRRPPATINPIPGTGKLERLEENMAAATLNLSDEDFRSL